MSQYGENGVEALGMGREVEEMSPWRWGGEIWKRMDKLHYKKIDPLDNVVKCVLAERNGMKTGGTGPRR